MRRDQWRQEMSWFWLNIPLATAIFAAMVGIPLWVVFKRPDTRTDAANQMAPACAATAQAASATSQPQPARRQFPSPAAAARNARASA
jgi:hypothetical protein